jgi:hypothetical protein
MGGGLTGLVSCPVVRICFNNVEQIGGAVSVI